MVPQERRKDFVRMREFLEVQAGVRSPDEVDNDVFDSDKGFGYVTYGDKAHFIGDDGPDGKPREYVTGSPEFKARLKKMEEQRKRHDGVLSEPGRIMQRYQDVYDQHKSQEQFAKLADERSQIEKWGRAGEVPVNAGAYPSTSWNVDQQRQMMAQGHPFEPKGMSKKKGPTREEIGGRTLEEFQAWRQNKPPTPAPPPSILGSPDQQEKARGRAKSLWDRIKQGPALPTGRFD